MAEGVTTLWARQLATLGIDSLVQILLGHLQFIKE